MVDKSLLYRYDMRQDELERLLKDIKDFSHKTQASLTDDDQYRLIQSLQLKLKPENKTKTLQDLLEEQYRGENPHAEARLESFIEGLGMKEEQLLAIYENLVNQDTLRQYLGEDPNVEAFVNKVQNPDNPQTPSATREPPKPTR